MDRNCLQAAQVDGSEKNVAPTLALPCKPRHWKKLEVLISSWHGPKDILQFTQEETKARKVDRYEYLLRQGQQRACLCSIPKSVPSLQEGVPDKETVPGLLARTSLLAPVSP